MDLRVLRSFLTVAREQTISGAAQALHLSQPTLSRQIMDLEEELGVTLFHRGNRKITLTDEGMLLRKRAEQITDLVQKTQEELSAPEDTVSGTIYIGAEESHAFRMLARQIVRLFAQYPYLQCVSPGGRRFGLCAQSGKSGRSHGKPQPLLQAVASSP